MATYASAHSPSHPYAENRIPNDDAGAMITAISGAPALVLEVSYAATKGWDLHEDSSRFARALVAFICGFVLSIQIFVYS